MAYYKFQLEPDQEAVAKFLAEIPERFVRISHTEDTGIFSREETVYKSKSAKLTLTNNKIGVLVYRDKDSIKLATLSQNHVTVTLEGCEDKEMLDILEKFDYKPKRVWAKINSKDVAYDEGTGKILSIEKESETRKIILK